MGMPEVKGVDVGGEGRGRVNGSCWGYVSGVVKGLVKVGGIVGLFVRTVVSEIIVMPSADEGFAST